MSRLGDYLPLHLAWGFNIGGPWLAVAFGLGATARGRGEAAARGVTSLLAAVVVYYGFVSFVQREKFHLYSSGFGPGWLGVALVAGAIFGIVGFIWRSGSGRLKPVAVAVLTGALGGEGWWLFLHHGASGDFLAGVEFAVAFCLPFILLGERDARTRALWLTAGIGAVAFAVQLLIGAVIRRGG